MFTNQYQIYKRIMFSTLTNQYMTLYDGNRSGNNIIPDAYKSPDIGAYMKYGRCGELAKSEQGNSNVTSVNLRCNPGVYFGSGSTPATKDDFKLQSPITSGLNVTSQGAITETNDGNGKYEFAVSFILQNTSGAEMNIWEIGLFGQVVYGSGSSHWYCPVLYERTVLDEPITIPAGESKLVTYKITFNQVLNVEA